MKTKAKYILLNLLTLIIITMLIYGCHKNNSLEDRAPVNDDLIQVKTFSVSSDSTQLNTSAKGAIFVKGTEDVPEQIQIVAQIEVDPDDWGGVAFYIPKKWDIESIESSYPDSDNAKSSGYTSTWITASDEYEWNKYIEIGRSSSYEPTGGGAGTIVIDLVTNNDEVNQSDKFNIMIAVGSDEKNGAKIFGRDNIKVEIP